MLTVVLHAERNPRRSQTGHSRFELPLKIGNPFEVANTSRHPDTDAHQSRTSRAPLAAHASIMRSVNASENDGATVSITTPASVSTRTASCSTVPTATGVTWKPGRTGSSTPQNPRDETVSASSDRD